MTEAPRSYPEAERLRQVLGAFYKTVDVMKSARNQNKAMAIWPDDMKAVEDVMVFLEQLRDQNSDGGVEKHGDFSQTRSESPGAQDRIAGVAPGPSDPAVQANWLANYATCFVDDERVGRRLIEIAEILRSGVLAQGSGDCGKLWTPDQFWQFVEGLTDPFVRDQIRDTMIERGLSLTSPHEPGAT